MRRIFILGVLAGLAVAGCAGRDPATNEQLTSVLEDFEPADYATTERCLSSQAYDTVEVLDDRHLLFESATGNRLWLNTLRSRCPGLRRDDVLLFEMTGNRLCSLDQAEVVERFLFWRRTGPVCSLGEFHQLTENQADLIREAIRSRS